eukprot:3317651-Heterocapsa_arctica.AAC.1
MAAFYRRQSLAAACVLILRIVNRETGSAFKCDSRSCSVPMPLARAPALLPLSVHNDNDNDNCNYDYSND